MLQTHILFLAAYDIHRKKNFEPDFEQVWSLFNSVHRAAGGQHSVAQKQFIIRFIHADIIESRPHLSLPSQKTKFLPASTQLK